MKILLILSLFFLGCAKNSDTNTVKNINDDRNGNIVSSSAFIEHDGDKVAYILYITTNKAQVYIPSVDRYAEINLSTGEYINTQQIFYSESNCSGTPITAYYPGQSGKTIIKKNDTFYLVASLRDTDFTYQSYIDSYGDCINGTFTFDADVYSLGNIVVSQKPYEFKNLPLPLNVKFD